MNINKNLLYEKLTKIIDNNELFLPIQSNLLNYLVTQNIFHNPTQDCIFQSHKSEWTNLPKNKSLFGTHQNCGLPIGNLTSQLYGNLYLNDFDHYIKKELGIKHYGRYVDDFYLFHVDKIILLSAIEKIKQRLLRIDLLKLHPKKIHLQNIKNGFSFLGIYILPYRKYIGKRIKAGLFNSLFKINSGYFSSLNLELERLQSYTSNLIHHNCFQLRKEIDLLLLFALSKHNYSHLKTTIQ